MTLPNDLLVHRVSATPSGGGGLWWPLRGAFTTYVSSTNNLAEIGNGTPHADKWTDTTWGYRFPATNGTPGPVVLRAAHDAGNNLEDVLRLTAPAQGVEVIVAWEMSLGAVPSGHETIWTYGANSTASQYGMSLWGNPGVSMVPYISYRPIGGGAAVDVQMTGSTALNAGIGQFVGQGRFVAAVAFRIATTGSNITTEFAATNGTLSCSYTTPSELWGSGATRPGLGTGSAAAHFGVSIGGRQLSSGSHDRLWGTTGGLVIGNWQAARFASSKAARLSNALVELLVASGEYALVRAA